MAVYTAISDDELREFISKYDLGEVIEYRGIAEGVENSNFFLRTTKNDYILTLYEKRVERKDLPFFLSLMEHLAKKKFPTPVPVRARDGTCLRALCGKPAVICSFLHGVWQKDITFKHCYQLGEAAAKLHLAASDLNFQRKNTLGPSGWLELAMNTKSRADEISRGLANFIWKEVNFLKKNWPNDLPTGIIHADLFPDNVFFLDENLSGIIDFYFACNEILAYEIAICINAWCFSHKLEFCIDRCEALIAGYNRIRPLTKAETSALPILCRGAALRFLLTRLYDVLNQKTGALVNQKDPLDYIARLQFHQQNDPNTDYLTRH